MKDGGPPSFTFFGGKGGVGKTTCAAIAALSSDHSERRAPATLLITTDPASSLTSVLRASIGPFPRRIARGVYAANIDATRAFSRWLEPRRRMLTEIGIRGTYLDDDDVARLLKLSLPGIDEIIGLLEIARLAHRQPGVSTPGRGAPEFDRVVIDTAPTGHTLRLLAAPALLTRVAGVLDALQSHHRAVVAALRGSYLADAADALIQELDRDGHMLGGLLRDPASTTIAWVTLPEPMALEETADAIEALERDGIHVGRLVVNRFTPSVPLKAAGFDARWCEARRRFEARALTSAARRFPDREILTLPDLGEEPRGVSALRRAAARISRFEPPPSSPAIETRLRAVVPAASAGGARVSPDTLLNGAQWLLFGGKGGVGKTTCAAAASLRLAETRRVLLLSTDPAHSLSDVFGAPLDDRLRSVPGGPATLHAREIDAAAEFDAFRRRYEDALDAAFARIAHAAGGGPSAFRDLIALAPPGIDEVIAVAEVASALAAGRREYDLVVTDTAPTGHALRLLRTPAILREWAQTLMTILRKYREIAGAGTLAELLVHLSKRMRALQEALSDAARTRFLVVTRAAFLPIEEAIDMMDALDDLRIPVGAVIVNALGSAACSGRTDRSRAERAELVRLERAVGGRQRCAIIGTPAEMPPPHGSAALSDWTDAWRQLA